MMCCTLFICCRHCSEVTIARKCVFFSKNSRHEHLRSVMGAYFGGFAPLCLSMARFRHIDAPIALFFAVIWQNLAFSCCLMQSGTQCRRTQLFACNYYASKTVAHNFLAISLNTLLFVITQLGQHSAYIDNFSVYIPYWIN